MRLRTKYALVLLVIVLVLGGVVLGSTELFKRQAIAQEQNELDQTAELTARQVAEGIDEQRIKLQSLANEQMLAEDGGNTTELRQFVNNTDFFALQVVSTEGIIENFRGGGIANPERFIGTDISNRTAIQEALEGNIYIENPESVTDGIYIVRINVPIAPRRVEGVQTAQGVLVGAVRVGVARGRNSSTASTGLLGPVRALERDTQVAEVTARTVNETTAVIRPARTEFDQRLTSVDRIDPGGLGTTWTLRVTRDRAALTDRLQTLQLIQGGSLLVVLGSMIGLGVWQYRTNLSQTEKLLDGFDALTKGEFGYELSMESAQEWQQIGQGFNELGTGLRLREEAIAERERRLSVLNRVLRHNVQNDLSVVQGYLEVMPDIDDTERQRGLASKGLEKTKKLIAHSTKAKQMDKAMDTADDGLVEIDATTTVGSVADSLRGDYPDAEITVETPDERMVWAIAALEYGIEALAENACEHVEEPTVGLSVARDGDRVRITVTDDGPGIPENEQDVLAKEKETDLEHGSGVGLWLAQLVAEKSDGELHFGDQSDGGHVAVRLHAGRLAAEELPVDPEGPV